MNNRPFFISLFTLLFTVIGAIAITLRGDPVCVKGNLEKLPMQIGGYKATEGSFTDSVYKELNADMDIYRHYFNPDGARIDLYIGYYGTAKGGRTGHNPMACLPGSGWTIVDVGAERVKPAYLQTEVEIARILARKQGIHQTVLHWYQSAGTKVLSTGLQQNIHRFIGRLLHNRNDGARVLVSVYSQPEGTKEALVQARTFAEKIMEELPRYWPIEEDCRR